MRSPSFPWETAGNGPWHENGMDPVGPAELLCHNDLGAWNLVRRPDGRWVFIDWDLVAPGRRAWDLSWALLSLVPLMPHTHTPDTDVSRRLARFRDAYGTDLYPARRARGRGRALRARGWPYPRPRSAPASSPTTVCSPKATSRRGQAPPLMSGKGAQNWEKALRSPV